MTRRGMRLLATMLLATALASPCVGAPRVVVLGFDGADANITRDMMAAGRLPNLAALAQEGSFAPLLPTNPPQTPVSWSTFATGLNPGRTQIFDFIKKRDGAYMPTLCAFDEKPRRKFLWGARNEILCILVGASLALVPALFAVAFRSKRRPLLVVALGLGLVGGVAGGLFARLLPDSLPAPRNNRKGMPFWQVADAAGLSTRILQVPVTFPAESGKALEMLSGLGVPDVRGLTGQPTLYTTRTGKRSGQFSVKVVEIADPSAAAVATTLEGPRNVLFPPRLDAALREKMPDVATAQEIRRIARGASVTASEMAWTGLDVFLANSGEQPIAKAQVLGMIGRATEPRIALPMTVAREGDAVRVHVGDRTSVVAAGSWSDWHVVEFPFNRLLRAKGIVRFYNQSTAEATELLASPINLHPDAGGLVGFCHPDDYAKAIAKEIGLYKTLGWASDTWTVGDELASEQEALEDIQYTTDTFEAILRAELARDTDLYVQVFAFTDRTQHIFWRLRDEGHPNHDAALAERYRGVIEASYERMDRIVGEARALAPDAAFFVLSDHGFASFRRGLNINRWLVDNGYLVLKSDPCATETGTMRSLDDLFENPQGAFSEVDWPRTRAFAMGLGFIYVNLAGREPQGIVRPGDEYDRLCTDIGAGLAALVDAPTGAHPVARVHRRDEMYSGYDPEVVPDLRVSNNDGYRVSWDTVLGGVPCAVLEDNMKPWGGDHCSLEPELVKGILFANRKLAGEGAEIADMAPTILAALGLQAPEGLDGRSLL